MEWGQRGFLPPSATTVMKDPVSVRGSQTAQVGSRKSWNKCQNSQLWNKLPTGELDTSNSGLCL